MRRTGFKRFSATLLVVLIHLAAITLFLSSRHSAEPDIDTILILPIHVPESAPPPVESKIPRRPPVRSPVSETPLAHPPAPTPPAESTAITVPPADLRAAMSDAARRVVERDAARTAKGEPLDAKPDTLQLPSRKPPDHGPGTVTQLPNGEVIVEFERGIICHFNRPVLLSELFDGWAQHRPAKCMKKGGDAVALDFETLKPGYLRRPLPLPRDAGDPPPTH